MERISLIAVDLDGTLLTSEKNLAVEGVRLLKQANENGIYVVIATTRNPYFVQNFCRMLNVNDPIICTNGAQIWGSRSGPVWAYYSIPQEIALEIAQLADRHNWELSTTVGEMTYWRQRPGQELGQIKPNITVVAVNSDAIIDNPVRILVTQPEAIDSIKSLCQSKFSEQCRTETYYEPDGSVHSLCIFAPEADKGKGLALVIDRLNIQEKVMAIGDNFNDLPMFLQADISVAMGNALDEIKQKATVVAPSNDDEGVAYTLKKFVLQ